MSLISLFYVMIKIKFEYLRSLLPTDIIDNKNMTVWYHGSIINKIKKIFYLFYSNENDIH